MCSAGGLVSNDCPKQNEQGTWMISGLTSGRIEDGESDASADREVDHNAGEMAASEIHLDMEMEPTSILQSYLLPTVFLCAGTSNERARLA
ncbi:hypothetical protein LINPERHAP1_LOCUS22777 [Linum perenne]